MLFAWLKKRRRRYLLAQSLPAPWVELFESIAHYRNLTESNQTRLRESARIFIAERTFEGCRGVVVTDEMRVTIAALACLLVLGWQDFYFDNVPTILVYPEAYVATEERVVGGLVMEGKSDRLGEAHYRGPLILSWAEVDWEARQTGGRSNLVLHEFAHQLDMLNGAADGVPPLPRALRQRWQTVMAREFERLCHAARHGQPTLIDPYGTTNPAEFFAVATECFFERPVELRQRRPALYDVLRAYYRQDPAQRVS
jgi:MtfA peptidase